MTKMSGQSAQNHEDIETKIAQIQQQQRMERPDDQDERIGLEDVSGSGTLDSDKGGVAGKKKLEGYHDTMGGEEEDDKDGVALDGDARALATPEIFRIKLHLGVGGQLGSRRVMRERFKRSWEMAR